MVTWLAATGQPAGHGVSHGVDGTNYERDRWVVSGSLGRRTDSILGRIVLDPALTHCTASSRECVDGCSIPCRGQHTPEQGWWQTWWAIVPGLALCLPVGLVGLWLRKGTSNTTKWIVTACVAVLVVAVIASPDSKSDTDSTTPASPSSLSPSAPPSHPTSTQPAPKPRIQRASVPVLTGMTLGEAREQLRADHLKGGFIERRPSSAKPGTVLSQGLRSGKQVARYSSVPLVIAVPLPSVPAIGGQSGAAALQTLRSAGFRTRTIHKTVSSGAEGVVLSQSPRAGQRVQPHALVTIVVAHVVRPVASTPPQTANCTPGYSPCLAPAYDYDCSGGSGDGPKYVYGTVRVTGSDPYGLDADGDGYGCD